MSERPPRLDPAALERLARAAREAASPAGALSRYELRRELGRGASGVVYEALDLELRRPVALKLLSRTAELSPDARARFVREARAAAKLTHPSIAAVHDANETFIAMQLVAGSDLAARPIRDPRAIAALVRDAALAVHYAHGQGVIHRDLKPANLIATEESPPRLVVTDFGLAKGADTDAGLSRSGSIVGTPSYMAPEQARGTSSSAAAAVDARTDVYGLGATLFDQIAGRPPFLAESVVELLRRVIEDEPPPLGSLARGVDRDLATIVGKCLEKSPERRYPSALALASDLDRWLRGEPVLARSPSLAYRFRRFVARRQGALAAAAGAALLVLAGVAPFWLQARARRSAAEGALVLAETVNLALDHAQALKAGSRPKRATDVLERATAAALAFSAESDVGRASLFLGRLYAAQFRTEDAVAAFDRALELDPSLDDARFERGLARGALLLQRTPFGAPIEGETEALRAAAIADLAREPERERSLGEPSRDAVWGTALLAFLRGDSELARRLCEDVIALDPRHFEARLVLARVASEAGDADRAMRLSAEAVDLLRGRLPAGSAGIEPEWTRVPGRNVLILDLRKAAAGRPTVTFANGALAQEWIEAGARSLARGDAAAALREIDSAETHLTHALRASDADPLILAVRGVASMLRDEALSALARTDEAARARADAARDLAAAGRLGASEVRVAASWNEACLGERRSLLASLAGDAAGADSARREAEAARRRAIAAAAPGSGLAALLREGR